MVQWRVKGANVDLGIFCTFSAERSAKSISQLPSTTCSMASHLVYQFVLINFRLQWIERIYCSTVMLLVAEPLWFLKEEYGCYLATLAIFRRKKNNQINVKSDIIKLAHVILSLESPANQVKCICRIWQQVTNNFWGVILIIELQSS